MYELYAHHKDWHQGGGNGNGNGNGGGNNNVPEIDGGSLPLAILTVLLFALMLKRSRRT